MKKNNTKDYEISSGNVFEDLGLINPEERLAKAEIARQINNLIKEKKINQADAVKLLCIDQSKIMALTNGNLSGFSLEQLFKFLNTLGQNITIRITPKTSSKKKSEISISLPKKLKKTSSTTTEATVMLSKKKAKN